MSITKNHQTTQVLHQLCADAFPCKAVSGITELTEGMFNAAYRVDFTDGSASVLKIAAADASGLLSNEIHLMQAEVTAMRILRAQGFLLVPQVQYVDFSHTRCSGSYFFMACLNGRSFSACRSELSEDVIDRVHTQVGVFQRRMAAIRSDAFGLLGDERRFPALYELIRYLFKNVLRDAQVRSIQLPMTADTLLSLLEADHAVFDEVKTPSLVHWDMWEGNIFVTQGELSGVIDWERAMWGEPLMDDRFRRHNRPAAFLAGYGQTTFSPTEQRRLAWYDLFLYLTMVVESFYRQYEHIEGTLAWLHPLLGAAWTEVQRR